MTGLAGNRAPGSTYDRIYAVVGRVPPGRVLTYGEVARLAGLPGRARQVGYALYALEDAAKVPWQRIVNAEGRVSARREAGPAELQRNLLEGEGIVFGAGGRIDLQRFLWRP